ncbi:MAG: enoyl-CoA hydratase/carnithine racemase [Ilumatobacter sp.]|jgi:enoyl-CoA hydratase/carnithine racemase
MTTDVDYETMTVSTGDGVAIITMNRPEKLNAMNRTFFRELPAVMAQLSADPGVTAAVLTGAGRAFSAGGDIEMFPALMGDAAAVRPHLKLVFDAFHSIERASVVVIAAVHGVAHGGGTEITLACDFAFASSDATFALREASLGLIPGFGLTRGPDVIGLPWTTRLATSAEVIDAETAASIGLVMQVVDPGMVVERALEVAHSIAANSISAVDTAKRFLRRNTDEGLAMAVESTALGYFTEDAEQAVQTFLNRSRR